jgi:hypothetical protein
VCVHVVCVCVWCITRVLWSTDVVQYLVWNFLIARTKQKYM